MLPRMWLGIDDNKEEGVWRNTRTGETVS